MKYSWWVYILSLSLIAFVAGCSGQGDEPLPEEGAGQAAAGGQDEAAAGSLPEPEIDSGLYSSVDGRVTLKVDQFFIGDEIPDAVHTSLSGESELQAGDDAPAEQVMVFIDTTWHNTEYESGSSYLVVYFSLESIEEGYLTDPRGFKQDKPLMACSEGSFYEHTVLFIDYQGDWPSSPDNFMAVPPGAGGFMLFEYPANCEPEKVIYYYTFVEQDDTEELKGMLFIPVPG